ncbi:MAG: FmdE family protein [Methanofollis sp.]|uniref:FmdE family protein n=1 Tax=Methanofollis sp. TaxID=2052835 RepID=UPI002605EF5B|nr:FmdE family protein [Methanofollis sp.]MDD4255121.1 FmdE family protein [Methanofollis sp.]
MSNVRYILLIALLVALVPGTVFAGDATMDAIGSRAAAVAMDHLASAQGNENMLAMTDAGAVMFGNRTTERCLKGVTTVSGCSIGDGNLLMPQRSKFSPLWFFFYRKDTGEAVFLQVKPEAVEKSPEEIKALPPEDVFGIIAKERIDAEYLLANQSAWTGMLSKKVFGGNEFSLITIANMWADPRTPYDFLRAASFHNHLCPGVSSGYLISRYVEERLPIEGPSQSYKVIACPVWCKDDLFPVIWDATPGKNGLFVKDLSAAEKEALKKSTGGTDVAGIYVRWNASTNTGDGLVVGYNWSLSNELTGTADWKGDQALAKLVMDLKLIDYRDRPEEMVTTLSEFRCESPNDFAALASAGVNPLKVLGVEA